MKAVLRSDNVIIRFADDVTSDDVDVALKNVDVFEELRNELGDDEFLVFEGRRGGFLRFVERVTVLELC